MYTFETLRRSLIMSGAFKPHDADRNIKFDDIMDKLNSDDCPTVLVCVRPSFGPNIPVEDNPRQVKFNTLRLSPTSDIPRISYAEFAEYITDVVAGPGMSDESRDQIHETADAFHLAMHYLDDIARAYRMFVPYRQTTQHEFVVKLLGLFGARRMSIDLSVWRSPTTCSPAYTGARPFTDLDSRSVISSLHMAQ